MIHPATELKKINDVVGYGVVATKFIPAGTITWVLDQFDRTFTPQAIKELNPIFQNILDIYSYRDSKGNAVLCWDHGRYVNHSFKSNCLSTAYNFEIAIRDIYPGEELTDDYGYLNVTEPFEGIDEGTDRKVVYPDDLLNFHPIWDKQIAAVFNKITDLEQPLKGLLSATSWQTIKDVISGEKQLESIASNYFRNNLEKINSKI